MSKLPPDGKEVPFVLPTFKPSYIQPQGARYSNYPTGQQGISSHLYCSCMFRKHLQHKSASSQLTEIVSLEYVKSNLLIYVVPSMSLSTAGSARSAYAERKAEILGISTKAYDIDPAAIPASHTVYHISPGSTLEDKSLLTTPGRHY